MTARRLTRPRVLLALIFLSIFFVINIFVIIMVPMPQQETMEDFVFRSSEVKTNHTKTRLNVIVLTHMSSGSTILGNMLNYHQDVFYIYEPLHGLRRGMGTNEWRALPKSKNYDLRNVFSTLLPDLFTCGFHEERTIKLVFPDWVRSYNAWYNSSIPLTNEMLRHACNSRKITATKIMQTRLPGEVGIRELERVCRSESGTFDCLIVHLVRDPRAVLSSLIRRRFFIWEEPEESLFNGNLKSPEGISFLKESAQTLCSLVSENLDHVNAEWSNWFKDRYILVRYEDAISNMSEAVNNIFKFAGLRMVENTSKWLKRNQLPGRKTSIAFNTAAIDKWRFLVDSSMVSLFEEVCGPMMEAMGYIFVNGSDQLQHNKSMPLRTTNIPFLKYLHTAK